MLFNITELEWDEELLSLLTYRKPCCQGPVHQPYIRRNGSADIRRSDSHCRCGGRSAGCSFWPGLLSARQCKEYLRHRRLLVDEYRKKPVYSKNGLLTTIAWGINDEVYYALEGSVFVAGAAVQWLRDELKIIEKSSDTEAMARSVPDTNGVYFVPAFVGLGAPYWDPYARGIITGLTRGVNRNHLVRATLEAIAYQTRDVLEAMQEDSGIRLAALKVDGGASENRFLMQFQADIIGTQVERPVNTESTALGAAYLAGLAAGYWSSLEDVAMNRSIDKVFEPSMDKDRRTELLQGWHKAVSRCRE